MAERAYKLEWLLGLEKETLSNMVLQQSKVIEKLQQAVKAQAVPEGFKIVPMEPTPEMIEAYFAAHLEWLEDDDADITQPVANEYKAMLAAAPVKDGA